MKALHGDIKPDNILIRGINPKVYTCIKIYERENFVKRYKNMRNEYVKSKGVELNNKKKVKISYSIKVK